VPYEQAEQATTLAGAFFESAEPPEFTGQNDIGQPTLDDADFQPLDDADFDGDDDLDDPQA
jgi:hypothetical protein